MRARPPPPTPPPFTLEGGQLLHHMPFTSVQHCLFICKDAAMEAAEAHHSCRFDALFACSMCEEDEGVLIGWWW